MTSPPAKDLPRHPRRRPLFAGALLCAALSAALGAGCVAGPAVPEAMSSARIRADAQAEGLQLDDPLALDPEILAQAERAVGGVPSPEARLRALIDYLGAKGYMRFEHTPQRSLTAREAIHERRGDCMAYTQLFVALARHLGLRAYFVHVTEVRDYYEKNGWFFVSSHVAVGQGSGPNATVIDFTRAITDWKLALYETIDDGAALALHYNNVAVDLMTSGRPDKAERLLRFLLDREPSVVELHNNLGVILNRRGLHAEALGVLNRGIVRFPNYAPLYTNAIRAGQALHRGDLVAWYERRGQALEQGDPYFLFARALTLFEQERFTMAARQFERASEAKPDSPVILAWLARSYLSVGRRQDGADAYGRARKLAPRERILDELEAEYPELRARP
jgi:tetratricopeptide (TPR) repeat protein